MKSDRPTAPDGSYKTPYDPDDDEPIYGAIELVDLEGEADDPALEPRSERVGLDAPVAPRRDEAPVRARAGSWDEAPVRLSPAHARVIRPKADRAPESAQAPAIIDADDLFLSADEELEARALPTVPSSSRAVDTIGVPLEFVRDPRPRADAGAAPGEGAGQNAEQNAEANTQQGTPEAPQPLRREAAALSERTPVLITPGETLEGIPIDLTATDILDVAIQPAPQRTAPPEVRSAAFGRSGTTQALSPAGLTDDRLDEPITERVAGAPQRVGAGGTNVVAVPWSIDEEAPRRTEGGEHPRRPERPPAPTVQLEAARPEASVTARPKAVAPARPEAPDAVRAEAAKTRDSSLGEAAKEPARPRFRRLAPPKS